MLNLSTLVLPPWISVPLKFLRVIPWWAWAAAAAIAAFSGWKVRHDHQLVAATEARVNAVWVKREKEAADLQASEVNRLRGELADWVLQYIATRDELAGMLREEGDKRRTAFDQLAKERESRVTPEAIARCDLTRGIILQFNAGADAANGEAHAAAEAEPPAIPNDASSGVSLARYARAVEDTQASLGICREQVSGWQRYCGPGGVVDAWYDGIRRIVNRCFPEVKATP